MIYITKERFQEFERVRLSGVTNMWHTSNICKLSKLIEDEVSEIRKNYSAYKEKYK